MKSEKFFKGVWDGGEMSYVEAGKFFNDEKTKKRMEAVGVEILKGLPFGGFAASAISKPKQQEIKTEGSSLQESEIKSEESKTSDPPFAGIRQKHGHSSKMSIEDLEDKVRMLEDFMVEIKRTQMNESKHTHFLLSQLRREISQHELRVEAQLLEMKKELGERKAKKRGTWRRFFCL
ncbi:Oidioi.mRNA.OKI2018_I69.chr1.g690.t1.cds [Oikopleura dioica]|uniref:Oidioi.mRNA.OKI2018_I69.chr1.g690.t1.cds n=1 Tax=Oikopleura dioica TaxID=34765 RepID=A0ABN7SQM2_OIKDI|nr:Oidioi.mRNA.OKI2018_I69.chr1.g690.t1.cds [Oikopleura dioica]